MSDVDVHALVDDADLHAISMVNLSARRIEREAKNASEFSVDPQYTLQTARREDDKGFRITLQTEIEAPIGDIRCDVEAEYVLQQLVMTAVPQEVLQEFVNDVAIMAMLPFVRQGIADITLRVFESPLLMPIIQRGQITFGLPPDETSGELED